MGVSVHSAQLNDFPGVRRRQAVLLARDGVTVIEDYAHHPAEIRALLASLRRRAGPDGRLVAVFQPHRFSRTAQFKSEFAAALSLADSVHLLDVYSAGEAPVAGGTTEPHPATDGCRGHLCGAEEECAGAPRQLLSGE